MSYALIEQWHKRAVSVERLCRVLGVSLTGAVVEGWLQRAELAALAR